jgi:hypothetical protein
LVLNSDGGTPCSCSDGGAFANAGNLEHCARYLNQTLVTFGFPASLDLFATDPVSSASLSQPRSLMLQDYAFVIAWVYGFSHVVFWTNSRG